MFFEAVVILINNVDFERERQSRTQLLSNGACLLFGSQLGCSPNHGACERTIAHASIPAVWVVLLQLEVMLMLPEDDPAAATPCARHVR